MRDALLNTVCFILSIGIAAVLFDMGSALCIGAAFFAGGFAERIDVRREDYRD